MAIWSVTSTSPNSGTVQDLGNGQFNFPTNSTSDNITYNVNFTDDNSCTAQTTYTIESGQECQCNCSSLSLDKASLIFNWNESGFYDSKEVTITSKGECITDINVSVTNGHFIMSYSGNKITIYPSGDNIGTLELTGTCTVSYKANDETCEKTVSLTQHAFTPDPHTGRITLNGCCVWTESDPYCGEDYFIIFVAGDFNYDSSGHRINTSGDYEWLTNNTSYYPGQPISTSDLYDVLNHPKDYCYMINNGEGVDRTNVIAYAIDSTRVGEKSGSAIHGGGNNVVNLINSLEQGHGAAVDCT